MVRDDLGSLVQCHFSDFLTEFSHPGFSGFEEIGWWKHASSDRYDKEVKFLAKQHVGQPHTPIIFGNAGGSDSLLSLYAHISSGWKQEDRPQLIVMDRKNSNLQSLYLRLMLAQSNQRSMQNFVLNLFGLGKEDVNGDLMGEKGLNLQRLEKAVGNLGYSPEGHYAMLMKGASRGIRDERMLALFEVAARNFTGYLGKNGHYTEFAHDFITNTRMNWGAHYLSSVDLYKQIPRAFDLRRGRFNVHMLEHDISTQDGLRAVIGVLDHFDLNDGPQVLDIAFIPHFMRDMQEITPWLKEYAEQVVFSRRDVKKGQRYWVSIDTTHLHDVVFDWEGAERYVEEAKNRLPLKILSESERQVGLPRVMVASSPLFGYKYSSLKTIEQMVEIANKSADVVITSGGVYGPFFFTENKRRALTDPDYPTLDSQLRAFRSFVDRINVPVVYVVGSDNDMKILDDLFALYSKKRDQIEKGQNNPQYDVAQMRADFNSRSDLAKFIIKRYVWPYMLRMGEDAALVYDEEGTLTRIYDIVQAFTRYHYGIARRGDEDIIDMDFVKDSEHLKVVFEHIASADGVGLRVFGNTNYSRVTQYTKPEVTLGELVKMAENGAFDVSEQVIVDMRQAFQGLSVSGDKVIVFAPHLVDDRRYVNPEMAFSREVLSDPVHKRVTIAKRANLPGAWLMTGDIRERMIVTPYYPAVFDSMERVQRTGQGYRDISVYVMHDGQLGSITERPYMLLHALDYAFFDRGAIGVIGIGDHVQGRNYRGMPVENWILGSMTLEGMQQMFYRMMRPFFTLPQVQFWTAAEGNHEWNTDREELGINFNNTLRAAIEQHVFDTGHSIITQFPVYVQMNNGDMVRAPFGYLSINSLGILYSHMYSQQGAGKGSSAQPSSHLSSWKRNMGSMARDYAIMLGAHYHVIDMRQTDNTMGMILGSTAGESGFEVARQYGGSQPITAVLHFHPDGHYDIELLAERFFEGREIQHPLIRKIGADAFIQSTITQEIYPLHGGRQQMPRMYRRDLAPQPPIEIN